MGEPGYALALHWAMVVGGIVVAASACYNAWRCMRAGSWPTVPGEVIHSDLEDVTTEDNEGGETTRYRPWVRYRYAVKDRNYLGRRVSFGYEWHWFEWTAQRVARRYPVGKRVRVHVSPADPEESSLESGVTFASAGALAGGIALIAAGFLWKF